MNVGGITYKIFDFAQLFVGRIHGGLGHVNVVVSMIFAGITDTSGMGMMLARMPWNRCSGKSPVWASTACQSTYSWPPFMP